MTKEREEFEKNFKNKIYGVTPCPEQLLIEELWSWHQQSLDRAVKATEEKYKDYQDLVKNSYLK